jgi:hypothetical protein
MVVLGIWQLNPCHADLILLLLRLFKQAVTLFLRLSPDASGTDPLFADFSKDRFALFVGQQATEPHHLVSHSVAKHAAPETPLLIQGENPRDYNGDRRNIVVPVQSHPVSLPHAFCVSLAFALARLTDNQR